MNQISNGQQDTNDPHTQDNDVINEVEVDNQDGKKMYEMLNVYSCVGLTVFLIPVVVYSIYAFGNPDGVGIGRKFNSCHVSSKYDRCLSEAEAADEVTLNITAVWMHLIFAGFIISLIPFIVSVVCNIQMPGWGSMCPAMTDSYWSVIWVIVLTVFRSIHAGKVVAGDFCQEKDDCTNAAGYMPWTGQFFLGWIIYTFIGIALFCSARVPPELGKNGFIKTKNKEYNAKYEHLDTKPIGHGACGTIWRVKKTDSDNDKVYVAKEFFGDKKQIKMMFTPEAAALRKINHPDLVKLEEIFGNGEPGSVIIMNFLKGETVAKVLQRDYSNMPIERSQLIEWLLQMAEAVRYMHCDIFMVHRDLHFGNWMLVDGRMTLLDFGLTFELGPNGVAKDYFVPYFVMSPENIAKQKCGFAADIWYLAFSMYVLVHPHHVMPWIQWKFTTEDNYWNIVKLMTLGTFYPCYIKNKVPHKPIPAGAPEGLDHLFNRMFDYDPSKRADITEVIQILQGIKNGQ